MLISDAIWKDVTYVTTLNKKTFKSDWKHWFIMHTIKYDKSGDFSDLKQTNQVMCVFTAQEHEVCGLPRLQAVYRLMTTDNLVKHGFLSTLDVFLMHGTNGTFLPRGGNGTIFFGLAPRPSV